MFLKFFKNKLKKFWNIFDDFTFLWIFQGSLACIIVTEYSSTAPTVCSSKVSLCEVDGMRGMEWNDRRWVEVGTLYIPLNVLSLFVLFFLLLYPTSLSLLPSPTATLSDFNLSQRHRCISSVRCKSVFIISSFLYHFSHYLFIFYTKSNKK